MTKQERILRARIKMLENQNAALEADRQKFREHFIKRFKWWIQLLGDSKTPSMTWLIEDDAKQLRRFELWWWQ